MNFHMRYFLWLILAMAGSASSIAQSANLEKISLLRSQQEKQILEHFFDFLAIPNVATDSANIGKNAVFLQEWLKNKGITNVQLLTLDNGKVPPVVYGEANMPGASRTVVFYAHYDGQPVNAALWSNGLHPFHPAILAGKANDDNHPFSIGTLKFPADTSLRIYARGASDDKGGITAILTAFDLLKQAGIKQRYNIKFFFEGEEEQGSPHLDQLLEKYHNLLKADLWIICDGPVHQSGRKQIVFGARGDVHLTLKTFGPVRPLHSGHYGNWAPNPVLTMARILASLKNEEGKVTVKGFYDDVVPLTATEKKAIGQIPPVDQKLLEELQLPAPESKDLTLAEAINLPSLNINGIESSNRGTIQANVIPVSATAVLDLRLVPGNDWQRQQQKVIDHLRSLGYHVTEKDPSIIERRTYPRLVQVTREVGYNAQRTSMDLPIAKKIITAVQGTTTEPVLRIPTLGGSLPLYLLEKDLNAVSLTVPIANYDNNQHAEDENIKIRNLWNGIETMAAIMSTDL